MDRESNKTVLFVGRDGGGVISYSGAAVIGGVHTDDIIASAIQGDDLRSGSGFTIRLGGGRRPADVGMLTLRVAKGLREAADAARTEISVLPRFVAAGFKWKVRSPTLAVGIRPFLWRGDRKPGRGTYSISHKPWDNPLWIDGLPSEWISHRQGRELFDRAAACGDDADMVSRELSSTIRDVSIKHPSTVGSDLMVVVVPNPATNPRLIVRFDGAPSTHGGWFPWIVAPALVAAPAPASNAWHMPMTPWEIVTEAPIGPNLGFGSSPHRAR